MEVLSVHLKNVRSFEEAWVPFGPGIVRIAGENGAGKSTVLAAIAYAVLGSSAFATRKYTAEKGHVELDHSSKLLRRGSEWGLVEVHFQTARAPGRRFRIHRVLGERPRARRARGQAPPQDPIDAEDAALVELDVDLSPGEAKGVGVKARLDLPKTTIASAVARLLDLSPETFAHGFEKIVAAPQGRLLAALNEDNRARREIYWKVLGVDRLAEAREDASRVGSALADRYLSPLQQAVADAARAVQDVAKAPEQVASGVVEVAEATESRDLAEKRRALAHAARDRAVEALAQAREREAEGARLARELQATRALEKDAIAAVSAAVSAIERRAALAPARELVQRLSADEAAVEARRADHALATAALEEARRRDRALVERDASDRTRLEQARRAEEERLRELETRAARVALDRTRLEAERAAADEQAHRAGVRRRSLLRWCERALPPLASLAALARDLGSAASLEKLARSAPGEPDARDLERIERARAIDDAAARASGDAEAARALVESWDELGQKVGSSGTCPFLREPCPHERGRDLGAVVREGALAARRRLDEAETARARAVLEQAELRAARERVEKIRAARETFRDKVAKLAPQAASAVAAFDRDRGLLEASVEPADLFFEPPPEASAVLAIFKKVELAVPELKVDPGEPDPKRADANERDANGKVRDANGRVRDANGKVRDANGKVRDANGKVRDANGKVRDAWDAAALEALARAARARREALAELPQAARADIERARKLAEQEADLAERSSAQAARDLERASALAERVPGELAELRRRRDQAAADLDQASQRHASEAAARAVEARGLVERVRSLEDAPSRFAEWKAAIERARVDLDELNRLEGVAAGIGAARERLEQSRSSAETASRRVEELGRSLEGEPTPAAFDLERLGQALAQAHALARRRGEDARRDEEACDREVVSAASALGIKQDRLVEAMRRRDELTSRQKRLERARAARDHVAHACSVLRGTQGEGPLAATLYKALGDLPGRLAERRVRLVSSHARRIYHALAPHETWDLVWDPKTYVLALAAAGTDPQLALREGIAVDDMSGGQQMSAALALHLALVHTYARNCDLLFLDEPTTNLDVKRRAALAECLRTLRSRVDGLVPLRQIVVVSHDEAFDALEDHTIVIERSLGSGPSAVRVAGPGGLELAVKGAVLTEVPAGSEISP